MAIISWKDCYATGISQFDEEHQNLVIQVNSLYEAIRAREADTRLAEIIPALVAYTETHFRHEEDLMQEHQYPDLNPHIQEHDELRSKVADFLAQLEQGNPDLPLQLFGFLREWLLNHIVETDGKYGEFFREKGLA